MKLFVKWILFIAGMIGIAFLNWYLLAEWHPLEYYWTIKGMLLSGSICTAETIALIPVIYWVFSKNGLINETVLVLKRKES